MPFINSDSIFYLVESISTVNTFIKAFNHFASLDFIVVPI